MADHQRRVGIWLPVARVMLLWVLLLVTGVSLVVFRAAPDGMTGSLLRWLAYATDETAFILPCTLFAAGVVLVQKLGYSRRVFRAAAAAGIVVGALAYLLAAWVAPVVDDQYLVSLGPETPDMRRFGSATPAGIARQIRFVEANPPDEYLLATDTPHRHPPNVLRWRLHLPVAMSVFGVINVFLGVVSAELTAGFRRGRRRTARLAIGVIGGLAFVGCMAVADPVTPFLNDGTMRSGVVGAWFPLVLPVVQALLFFHLVRRRRYG